MSTLPPRPAPPAPRLQFGLLGLLIFITGACVLFAVLAALGVSVLDIAVGTTTITLLCAGLILLIEATHVFFGRPTSESREPPLRPYSHYSRLAPPPHRRVAPLDIANVDSTGITFMEPSRPGIELGEVKGGGGETG